MSTKETWYPVPPYKNGEGWKILNQTGELVATFEEKDDCIKVAELFNNREE